MCQQNLDLDPTSGFRGDIIVCWVSDCFVSVVEVDSFNKRSHGRKKTSLWFLDLRVYESQSTGSLN